MFGKFGLKPIGANASVIELTTGNGRGTTSTCIRRYAVVKQNIGPAMTYNDSGIDGMSVLVNLPGTYFMSSTDTYTGVANIGISLNSNQLTTLIISITLTDRIGIHANSGNVIVQLSRFIKLNINDIVRVHQLSTGVPSVSNLVNFYMIYMG